MSEKLTSAEPRDWADAPQECRAASRRSGRACRHGPELIVTVDTEEEGHWNGSFSRAGHTVRNVAQLGRFQALCEATGVPPTYLVDTPVVDDEGAVGLLRPWQEEGRCEIGAHLHPWCAPPFGVETSRRNSYLCNLPPALQREKLQRLTERIQRRFGRRPTAFRAGRYGLDAVGARWLEELGYVVDSSVLPFTDLSADGGPDFRNAPFTPYFIAPDDLCMPASSGALLEVPVSVGFSRARFRQAQRLRLAAESRALRPLRVSGLLDAVGLARRIKFTPEFNQPKQLAQLVDAYAANGAPCMVLLLHSSSLTPGGSPYAKTSDDVERTYATLRSVLEHCVERRGMKGATLTQFALSHVERGGLPSGPKGARSSRC